MSRTLPVRLQVGTSAGVHIGDVTFEPGDVAALRMAEFLERIAMQFRDVARLQGVMASGSSSTPEVPANKSEPARGAGSLE